MELDGGSVRIKSHDPAPPPPNPYSHTPSKAPAPRNGTSLRSGIQGLPLTSRTLAAAHLGPLVKVFSVPARAPGLRDVGGEHILQERRTVVSLATPDTQIAPHPVPAGAWLSPCWGSTDEGRGTWGLLPSGGGAVGVEGRVLAPFLPSCGILVSAGRDTEAAGQRVRLAPDTARGRCRALRAASQRQWPPSEGPTVLSTSSAEDASPSLLPAPGNRPSFLPTNSRLLWEALPGSPRLIQAPLGSL